MNACRLLTHSSIAALLGLVTVAAQARTGTLDFTLNGRSVTMPLDTPVQIDDQLTTLDQLRYRPNGMQARWDTAAVTIDGAAPTPFFTFTLIGPVTHSSPIAVLGQPLTITADTTLAGLSPPYTLPLGTPVVVAGLVDANGSIHATLVERRGQAGARFLLTGQVQAVGVQAGSFRVGDQWVSAPAVSFAGCATATPGVGESVELRANAVANFPPGSVLDTVTDGRCVAPVPGGTPGAVGLLQGLVTTVPSDTQFTLGTLTVDIVPATAFVFGSVDDLGEGVGVTVDGNYVDAHTFEADVVEFMRPVVRYQAPLTPAAVTPGVSLSPFGIPVRWTAQVRDEDGILANGLSQSRQVEIRGYLDSSGQAHATRVRERGGPNANSVRLRGPVQAINAPFITIQGLTVDTSGDTFVDEYDVPMTAQEFFGAVEIDHEVDVSGGIYNAANATISGGAIVWIGAEPVIVPPPNGIESKGTAPATVRAGTAGGYAFIEPMFRDGFE